MSDFAPDHLWCKTCLAFDSVCDLYQYVVTFTFLCSLRLQSMDDKIRPSVMFYLIYKLSCLRAVYCEGFHEEISAEEVSSCRVC